MTCDKFYMALEMQATAEVMAVPEMPDHKFSRKYEHKKKLLINAYEKSQSHNESFAETFRKLRLRRKIQVAVIITALVLLLTGGSVYVAYSKGGFEGYRQSTHTELSFVNYEGACETLYPRYYLTYDLNGWNKEILCDETNKYSEIYRNGDKSVIYSYETWDKYTEHNPESDFEEMHPGGECVEGRTLHHINADGSERLIWTDNRYWLSIDYNGISYDEAVKIRESSYAPTYQITYDMSDWEEELMSDCSTERWVVYRKGEDEFSFEVCTKESYQKVHLNTEGGELESRVVNGHEGIYLNNPDHGFQYLAYDNGDYIFEFIFTFDYNKAMDIINSIEMR